MSYRYVFGPVHSRRLGYSLGIDPVPRKACSMDCVYCEVGRTAKWTLERKEWVPTEDILDEEDAFVLEDLRDDTGLKMLAGKLNKVLRDRKFKKFLEAKPEGEEPETEMIDEERTPMPTGAEEMDLDALFMERM